ncbi:PAS domain-containing protein [Streptomyces sp. MNP-20]|uniref:PAS domain-containing protein n=1 Tax=Streptomyces sp. MNP-20 TaxID=2721165 RepID=UPI00155474B4|nr:PAS domain-containing protein [Streptomyces sp. MNP-20]
MTDTEGGRGYDLRYPQHPDVAAHLRARAGETVVWSAGWNGGLRACVAPFLGQKGLVDGVIGAAVDTAQLKQERERRNIAEQTLYAVLDQCQQAIALLDSGQRVLFANRAYLNAAGQTLDDVLGRQEPAGVRTSQPPGTAPTDGNDAARRQPALWQDVRGRYFRSTHVPLPVEAGGASCHLATDVTEVEELRKALADSRAQAEAVCEGVARALAMVDSDGRVECANTAFHRMLGASYDQLIGTAITGWVEPTSYPVLTALHEALKSEAASQTSGQILFRASSQMILAVLTLRRVERTDGSTATVWTIDTYGEPAHQLTLQQTTTSPTMDQLDARILELLAAGHSNADIATHLSLSRQGLDYRLKMLRTRLHADSRGALVARAYHQGVFQTGHWPPRCHTTAP